MNKMCKFSWFGFVLASIAPNSNIDSGTSQANSDNKISQPQVNTKMDQEFKHIVPWIFMILFAVIGINVAIRIILSHYYPDKNWWVGNIHISAY